MNRRTSRSTRTDTRFPYTTLFRSGADLQRALEHLVGLVLQQDIGGELRGVVDQYVQAAKFADGALDHRFDLFLDPDIGGDADGLRAELVRSEEHTSELQSLMRISYAVFCLKKTNHTNQPTLLPLTSE